jgi:hypothetical protein
MDPAEHGVHEIDVDICTACFDFEQLPFDVGQVVPRLSYEFGQQFWVVERHADLLGLSQAAAFTKGHAAFLRQFKSQTRLRWYFAAAMSIAGIGNPITGITAAAVSGLWLAAGV